MGEIKSTLDLVMERTRHLSLSEEERQHQQAEEFEKRLQGLLQQYADGALDPEAFEERTAALQIEMNIEDRQVMIAGVVQRIDPDDDNAPWLTLLGRGSPVLSERVQGILDDHRLQQADMLAVETQGQLARLHREHDISGTAVVSNPGADPAYRQRLSDLSKATRARLADIQDQTAT
ncbi:MAG: hypothetical protein QNI97_18670 [Desulfobacterales bacterium]|nr:hypothetical protein [Desulfobacterales bacterium]MDJ0857120.1 hypothetical protein [Desulfobacterales bacterium]